MTSLTMPVPLTLDGALDVNWLNAILAVANSGKKVIRAEIVDPVQVNQTVKATIVRFRAHIDDGSSIALCLKGFLDRPNGSTSEATLRESLFYTELAHRLPIRSPGWEAAPIEKETGHGILYMHDMVEQGAHFCSALEPFDANRTARSLEQLAMLHNSHQTIGPVQSLPWAKRQIDWLANYMTTDVLQKLLDDSRAPGIPEAQRDAARLITAFKALTRMDATLPACLIHGDCHAGNVFETKEGAGLIDFQMLQQGGWALDVAYHICATLPIDAAERDERALLRHYLEFVKGMGGHVPDDEAAWDQYRASVVYGYFMWAITRTVRQDIIEVFCHRLSHAVQRLESYELLGV